MLYPNSMIGAFMSSGSLSEDLLFSTVCQDVIELIMSGEENYDKAVNFSSEVLGWRCFFLCLQIEPEYVTRKLCLKFYDAMISELEKDWDMLRPYADDIDSFERSMMNDIDSKKLLFFRSIPSKYVSIDGFDFSVDRSGRVGSDYLKCAPDNGVSIPDLLCMMAYSPNYLRNNKICGIVNFLSDDFYEKCGDLGFSSSYIIFPDEYLCTADVVERIGVICKYLDSANLEMFNDSSAADLVQFNVAKVQLRAFHKISSLISRGEVLEAYKLFFELLNSFCRRASTEFSPVDSLVDSMGISMNADKLTYGEYFLVNHIVKQFVSYFLGC